ncbi:L-threonylcarbamoyladenylate synthase [Alteraurantiacibacter aquimixticola]|uniref:Threonylcarbamoyl-AMP synthase n=1 Tax=Alteraurantiacibacter aquimixticola TaxID=2489173 RepID=A0A4T3EX56_9SPHN|nr:L-threonylcarbamoyladenylate synthase [Alteraurantiacibacter aquimixticola]TIX49156.1 threonylcarbamoyl-AMP synthase [Alteraurantiacibacter aquimixticola]
MTTILPGNKGGIAQAVALLREGRLVALPTETVYGLAARADSEEAVAAIYRAKGRPSFNPLIVHVSGLEMAQKLAVIDERAERLADILWPGPLTLVLPLKDEAPVAPAVTAGLPTIALRMPAHPLARAVIAQLDLPLAAPSANRSMGVSPTRPEHVAGSLGEGVDAILDGGECERGLESTIVALRETGGWNLLREGPVTREELCDLIGTPADEDVDRIEAPGQMVRHYSPGKPVRLDASEGAEDEFLIGFGAIAGDCSLSEGGDLAQAAARLYACLHLAAASPKPRIAVAPILPEGIGAAINDRLRRAAA